MNWTWLQGYQCFQLFALNGLSLLRSIIGNLSRIGRIHRLEGTGGATPDIFDRPIALACHLINSVLKEKGAHSRMIYTNPGMPINYAKLLAFWAEIKQ